MAEAVHLKEHERAGTDRDLLLPPDGCKILKGKFDRFSIGILKTDLISAIISPSVIEEDSLIFPISPLQARKFLICFERGIETLFPIMQLCGRHNMSLSYVKNFDPFAVFLLFCCLLRKDDGSACLLYNIKHHSTITNRL